MSALIGERIKTALSMRGLKQSDLVHMTGIGKASISSYVSGAYTPKQTNISKIAKALNVNVLWLGGMDDQMEIKHIANKTSVETGPAGYNELSEKNKRLIEDIIKVLLANSDYS